MKRLLLILPFILACGIMPLPAKSDVLPTATESHEFAKKQGQISTRTPAPVSFPVLCVSASKSLNLRLSPSTSAEADPVGLQHGDRVERIGAVPGWYKIVTADGRRGWVKASYLEECDGT